MKIHHLLLIWAIYVLVLMVRIMYAEYRAGKALKSKSEKGAEDVPLITLSQILDQGRTCRTQATPKSIRFLGRQERGLKEKSKFLRKLNKRFLGLQMRGLNF